jgi:hypothetical protein
MTIEADIQSGRLRLVYAREDKDGLVYATFAASKTFQEQHGDRVEARQKEKERPFGRC